jgi:hypothetical protein
MQKEKLAWKQPAYYLSKLVKDVIKSKLKYKNGDEIHQEVNLAINSLKAKIIKLEADNDELSTSLDMCRHRCWDHLKEIQSLRASGYSLSKED